MSHADGLDALNAVIAAEIQRRHDMIEEMCERMLTTPGDRGVLVTDGLETFTVELSDDVPFGQIYYVHPDSKLLGQL